MLLKGWSIVWNKNDGGMQTVKDTDTSRCQVRESLKRVCNQSIKTEEDIVRRKNPVPYITCLVQRVFVKHAAFFQEYNENFAKIDFAIFVNLIGKWYWDPSRTRDIANAISISS